MTKFKEDITRILEILAFMLIPVLITSINNPVLTSLCLLIWFGVQVYNLVVKIRFRKGKSNYLFIPTENDEYHKLSQIILGLIIFLVSIVAIFWTKDLRQYEIYGMALGIVMAMNGFFDLPNGYIEVKAHIMKLTGVKPEIDIRQLEIISINKTTIELTNIYQERIISRYLKIDEHYACKIEEYLQLQKTSDIRFSIENNVC